MKSERARVETRCSEGVVEKPKLDGLGGGVLGVGLTGFCNVGSFNPPVWEGVAVAATVEYPLADVRDSVSEGQDLSGGSLFTVSWRRKLDRWKHGSDACDNSASGGGCRVGLVKIVAPEVVSPLWSLVSGCVSFTSGIGGGVCSENSLDMAIGSTGRECVVVEFNDFGFGSSSSSITGKRGLHSCLKRQRSDIVNVSQQTFG